MTSHFAEIKSGHSTYIICWIILLFNFRHRYRVRSITLIRFEIISRNLVQIKYDQTLIVNCYSFYSFYALPQKVAGCNVIPSELFSVCPSVCPSVRPSVRPSAVDHSCPLYNFNTVQDNFTKLGTNVKHDQTTCRDQQPSLHLHFLRNYSPLKFSV